MAWGTRLALRYRRPGPGWPDGRLAAVCQSCEAHASRLGVLQSSRAPVDHLADGSLTPCSNECSMLQQQPQRCVNTAPGNWRIQTHCWPMFLFKPRKDPLDRARHQPPGYGTPRSLRATCRIVRSGRPRCYRARLRPRLEQRAGASVAFGPSHAAAFRRRVNSRSRITPASVLSTPRPAAIRSI